MERRLGVHLIARLDPPSVPRCSDLQPRTRTSGHIHERAGAPGGTPAISLEAVEAYLPGAGHTSGAGGISMGTRGRWLSAVGLSAA